MGDIDWYHTIDLGEAGVTPGFVDHRAQVQNYGLPSSLAGKRCLDVATFDGFWAFEMEKRGAAEVIGIDVNSLADCDYPRNFKSEYLSAQPRTVKGLGFAYARRALRSRVQRRAQPLSDFPVARLQAAAKLTHAILVAEQRDHSLIARNRAFVDLEATVEGDPHPGIDGRVHRPVGNDAVAVGRPGPDRPSQPMAERRPEAVGHSNDASSNLARRSDHASATAVGRSDIARFRLRTELDARLVAERVDQARIERESADPESGLLATLLGKGHGHWWLPGGSELDSMEGRRTAGHDRILQAQLPQDRPAARHQPFAARLVTRKGLLVDDQHPISTPRGKEGRGGSGWPGANHRDIGVDAWGHRLNDRGRLESARRSGSRRLRIRCGFRRSLRTLRPRWRGCRASRLGRDRDLRRSLTLGAAREACADQFAPAARAVGRSPSRLRKLAKCSLASCAAPFPVTQVGDRRSGCCGNPEPEPADTVLCARVLHLL